MVSEVRRRALGLLAVAAGGGAGTLLRHGTVVLVGRPRLAVLLVNVVGCGLLGAVLADSLAPGVLTRRRRLLVATGFCASLTTYSTFVLQTATARPLLAVGYVVASYAAGLLAVLAGQRLARAVAARSEVVGPPAGGSG